MSRVFLRTNNPTDPYLRRDEAVVTANPFTISAWVYPTDNSYGVYHIASLVYGGAGDQYFALTYRPPSDCFLAEARNSSGLQGASSPTGVNLNQWYHVLGIWLSPTNKVCYKDGVAGTPNAVNTNPTYTVNRTGIGGLVRNESYGCQTFAGRIAEVAIWSTNLLDGEIRALANGVSPLLIARRYLKAYWPLVRLNPTYDNPDYVGGFHLADYHSPTDGPHCKVLRPAPVIISKTAEVPASPVPAISRYYRNMRVA